MHRLYLTYKNTKEGYIYSEENNSLALNSIELEAYLKQILSTKIKRIRSINENVLEVTTADNKVIIIDNIKIFSKEDNLDSYYESLENQIKSWLESENIDAYKNSLPNGYIPRVIRRNKKEKYLVEEGLTTNIMLSNGPQDLSMDLSEKEMYNREIEKGR